MPERMPMFRTGQLSFDTLWLRNNRRRFRIHEGVAMVSKKKQ